jgi:cell wall-associated NlpC family hydrolase
MKATDDIVKTGNSRVRFHLAGRSARLDTRVHAVRRDLADISLAGILFAPHYAQAQEMHCATAGATLHEKNTAGSTASSQLLLGESFHVLDITGDWAWGFCGHDGYVGYIQRTSLCTGEFAPTHRISAISAPVFAENSIKSAIREYLPCGALIEGAAEGDFIATPQGFVHSRHAIAATQSERDWTEVAMRYLGQPYVWGGRGHGGVDCSGLVQIALGMCGRVVPRDSDLQRDSIGEPLPEGALLKRGDFVFFPGHVGIMADEAHLLHANAHWMSTVIEPLADVLTRLAPDHAQPILSMRRITP